MNTHTHTLINNWWRRLGYLLSSFLHVCLRRHDIISKKRCNANKPWKLHAHGNKSYIYRTDFLDFWVHLKENGDLFSSFFLSAPVRHHLHRPAAGAEVCRAGVHPRLHQDLSEHTRLVPRLHLHAVQYPHSAGHDSHQVGVDSSSTNRLTSFKCTDVRHRIKQLETRDS